MHNPTIISLLAFVFVHIAAQTVYIDVDSGKIVGIEQGKSNKGNRGNPHRYQERPRQHPNYYPTYPNQQRPSYDPYYQPQTPRYQEGPPKTLNTEWVCRDPKTGSTMIIASENGRITGPPRVPINQRNPYEGNPWLEPLNPQEPQNNGNGPRQDQQDTATEPTLPAIILTPAPIPQSTPAPPGKSTKPPFPSFDNIDWTQFLDNSTSKPPNGGLSAAIDGEGVIERRGGER